jgi:hypothetical protein
MTGVKYLQMMEPLLETVDLDMEESNELAFKIKVEGTANSPAKVRLVCEGSDVSYMFNGRGTGEDGVVQFVMPQMKDKLQEGVYQARVEVLIENRYFSPVQFQINFKKAMKVVAEALFVQPKSVKPEISVSAQPVVAVKPIAKISTQPLVVEQSKPAPAVKNEERQAPQRVSPLKERYLQKNTSAKNMQESIELDDEMINNIARALKSARLKR